jgi:hypothetical protein
MNDETIEQATSRTIFEKTMNLIIEPDDFEKIIPTLPYIIDNDKIIFTYKIDYDEYKNIAKYYNKIFAYLNLCTSNNTFGHTYIETCPIGFLDKSELRWFTYNDIHNQEKLFNDKFYLNLNKIINNIIK